MDDMMKIHLLIDNERYPMTIRREDEQLYRDAAKQIDNKLTNTVVITLISAPQGIGQWLRWS